MFPHTSSLKDFAADSVVIFARFTATTRSFHVAAGQTQVINKLDTMAVLTSSMRHQETPTGWLGNTRHPLAPPLYEVDTGFQKKLP